MKEGILRWEMVLEDIQDQESIPIRKIRPQLFT